ncbi:MAG: FHA domain-containing protein [Pelolinea sp.]|nr:FHA domain-containing protein [Pelolinea sp.]
MSAFVILILRALAAISLYICLGLIIFILWRDLFKIKNSSDIQSSAILTIKNLKSGESDDFSISEIFIGRSDLAHIQLQDDDTVSNMHARIFYKGKNWWLEDLQSTNGTLINEDPIVTPIIITSGDQISCGKTIIEISLDENSNSHAI